MEHFLQGFHGVDAPGGGLLICLHSLTCKLMCIIIAGC